MTAYNWASNLIGLPAEIARRLPRTYTFALTPSAITADTVVEQTFTASGLTTDDIVTVNKPTAQADIGIVGARVSATNTLAITFVNIDAASARTPTAAEVYKVVAQKVT
jgi:hypothetical protein